MKFEAAFYDEQAKSGARSGSHIASAMKRLEQVLLIFAGNADPLVPNDAYRVGPIPLNRETYGRPRL